MSDSLITNTLNHLSNAAILSGLMGGIGYLCARHVTYLKTDLGIEPLAGIVCGAASGAILGLFYANESNTASKVIGLVAIIFVPFKVCERLEIPITFKATLVITAITVAITSLASLVFSIIEF